MVGRSLVYVGSGISHDHLKTDCAGYKLQECEVLTQLTELSPDAWQWPVWCDYRARVEEEMAADPLRVCKLTWHGEVERIY